MNLRSIALTAALAAVPVVAAAVSVSTTKRVKTEVREGPGNYYPLVCVLAKGARVDILEAGPAWASVKAEGKGGKGAAKGWIAKNCLAEKAAARSAMDLDLAGNGIQTSAASVAAAVRGFATHYGRATAKSLAGLQAIKQPFFTVEEYLAFKRPPPTPAPSATDGLADRYGLLLADYDTTLEEDGIGTGMSARVAAEGLVNDAAKLRYLNMLAALLAESSAAYDHPFRVYLTKGKQVNAVAVPGGTIFLSRPLVAACRDEAQLAAVIAHEMTHVILRHGLKELKARATEMRAEQSMDELDAMTGDAPDADAEELQNWASDAYEVIHKPRLQGLEEEADAGAVLLLARAGYDPKAVAEMISRVGDAVSGQADNPFSGMDYKKRAAAAREAAALLPDRGARNKDRFDRAMPAPAR